MLTSLACVDKCSSKWICDCYCYCLHQGERSEHCEDNCALFALTPPYYRAWAFRRCHLNFSSVDPHCHGNKFWDKIDYNSAPVKDNCALFAPTPYFRARAIRWCHLNLSHYNPCCCGN